MNKSVVVTIRPHITPERAQAMVDVIANKLWPGAAGAAQMITKQKIGKQLLGLAYTVTQKNQAIKLRVKREGMSFTLEPMGVVE